MEHRIHLLLWLSLMLFCHTQASAQQDTLILDNALEKAGNLRLDRFVTYHLDSTGRKSFQDIRSESNFSVLPNLPKGDQRNSKVWLKLTIDNPGPDTLRAFLFVGYHVLDEVYETTSSLINPLNEYNGPHSSNKYFRTWIEVLPQQRATYWIKTSIFLFRAEFKPMLFSEKGFRSFKKFHSDDSIYEFSFRSMLMGLCFFLGLFAFAQSIRGRDVTYAYWALYLWSNFFYFFAGLDRHFSLSLISEPPKVWIVFAQFPIQITYLLFFNAFINIKQYDRLTFKVVQFTLIILSLSTAFAFYAVYTHTGYLRGIAENLTFVSEFIILLIFIRIVYLKIPGTNLLMIGFFGLLIAAILATLIEQTDVMQFDLFWFNPPIIYSLGIVFELLFFSLALSQRTLQIKQENQRLQENYTRKLEADLAERVSQNQIQNALLEEQRVQQITSDFEQRIAQTEVAALRTQMNPHFIFNCLNSIKLYTLESKSEEASDYLTKFSRLIRLVLENSRSEKVTLENELETLTLYAEMEVMRFKNKLQYQLIVAPDIDQLFIEMPPLLLQPFVENAIWHGLMHKEDGGTVRVEVTMPSEKLLHVEVTDDGVGRQKSAEFKSKSAIINKSFGMKVTNERIELINQIYNTHTLVNVLDLKDPAGRSLGTKVIIEIPV